MLTLLTVVAALTRLAANWAVGRKLWWGWAMKLPSIAVFAYLNWVFGLWALQVLGVADLANTLSNMLKWRREAEPVWFAYDEETG